MNLPKHMKIKSLTLQVKEIDALNTKRETEKETDKSTIQRMEKEIDRLKVNVFEAESFIMEQHQLGFDKALQQAKYFYKIPIDEGNFDVEKMFIMVN